MAKLNSAISAAEKQAGELYTKIGYAVYVAYRENPLPEVAELIAQIKELQQTIEDSKEQINVINGVRVCPQCGGKVARDVAFCSNCGFKMPEIEQPQPQQGKVCAACGTALTEGAAFCTACGQKVE